MHDYLDDLIDFVIDGLLWYFNPDSKWKPLLWLLTLVLFLLLINRDN
ncbi:hypothetical protein [Hymenobacter glacieicola]|uniref:Uncharacterized protein n=1 Tax=Hymenobacter glacieicola TaxID=1562124 RepID=A0ABQ1X752_9BACT|nr:hypothetical protein [Hymenobacter glacieicola]GGG61096.1 hypothetical protein GCM10011378_41390 [Hymenobacter glacieicola]